MRRYHARSDAPATLATALDGVTTITSIAKLTIAAGIAIMLLQLGGNPSGSRRNSKAQHGQDDRDGANERYTHCARPPLFLAKV